MDTYEGCVCCRVLYESIATKFRLFVERSSEVWTQEFCVGLVDLTKISPMHPIDLMALDGLTRSAKGEGQYRLVAHFSEKYGVSLGIIHDRMSSSKNVEADLVPSVITARKRIEKRICMYDCDVLTEITRKTTAGRFRYAREQDTNLGYVTSSKPRDYQVFDLTTWLGELFRLNKYDILGVWCYANANPDEKSFALEVVTDYRELNSEKETKGERKLARGGTSWLTVWMACVVVSSLLIWVQSFATHF